MRFITHITLLVYLSLGITHAQNTESMVISGKFENIALRDAIGNISASNNVHFSYQSNLPGLNKIINHTFNQQPIKQVLESLLINSGISFKIYAEQVVLFAKTNNPGKLLIDGKLCRMGTEEAIPFAGIELKAAHKGTMSDILGYFRMEIDAAFEKDTLYITSLNYHPIKIPVKNFNLQGMHTFYMNERIINLPVLEIVGEKGKLDKWGNRPWFSSGSFYLDTHSQQTALFIENEDQLKGSLVSVNVFLSKRGNTDAPFRIHVYLPDSITGKPGNELLPEMVILKPDLGKGWFNINLSRFKVQIPTQGFFIAIEGLFPGDYDFYYNNETQIQDTEEPGAEDEFDGETISYGQQIGYSGGSKNNTWHYSVDGNWFQLKKKHFNAMISVEVKVPKIRNRRGFLGLWANKKETKKIDI
jgi:hypothetical protein